jgi:deoxyribonuclease V
MVAAVDVAYGPRGATAACVLFDDRRPGLGARLFEALGGAAAVIGVAKRSFMGSAFAEPVLRGRSASPLYVTSAGVDATVAAGWIRGMHGGHRIPTLLARADRLCRDGAR